VNRANRARESQRYKESKLPQNGVPTPLSWGFVARSHGWERNPASPSQNNRSYSSGSNGWSCRSFKLLRSTRKPQSKSIMERTEKDTEQTHLHFRLAYTLKETAQVLGVSYMTAFRLCQRGKLRSSSALRTKLISRAEIERFLKDTTKA